MNDPSMTLPVSPDNIHAELAQARDIVAKWHDFVGSGIPGIDHPTQDAEMKLDVFLRQFTGELLFVAGKLSNMAAVLSER